LLHCNNNTYVANQSVACKPILCVAQKYFCALHKIVFGGFSMRGFNGLAGVNPFNFFLSWKGSGWTRRRADV
jgi:hypothetical protein